ncbi:MULTISPECIES: flavin reductase family protein [Amycolatopsis]|uniref:flavin reductase family protein n=1 Tax=Amycolatopsis TaxID=1813 RepID=UPI000B8AA16F|nr:MULTISPECIES: flavin reductase family protein [Amycolatopsis]OXM67133.1 flavin reductase [Amycolatopsis sp. KNN50.9b]
MTGIVPVATGDQLRQAFGCFPSGVAAVSALIDDRPVGLAVSSFTSVSLSPPLVSVCMQHTSTTWPILRQSPRLGLSVLSEDHRDTCMRLAGKATDRFAGTDWTAAAEGGVFVHGATLWLDCSIHAEVPAGDHDIVLLLIHGMRADPRTAPLVFHGSQFHRLTAA